MSMSPGIVVVPRPISAFVNATWRHGEWSHEPVEERRDDNLGFAGLDESDRTPSPRALRERCAPGDAWLLERVERG